jgi:alcohol dehydrogenase class IV
MGREMTPQAYLIIRVDYGTVGDPSTWAWGAVAAAVKRDQCKAAIALGGGELELIKVVHARTGETIYEADPK